MKVVINQKKKRGYVEFTKEDILYFSKGINHMSKNSLRVEPILNLEVIK